MRDGFGFAAKGGGSRKPKTKKVTGLGIGVKKSEDFAAWYTKVITRSELIDYYDISGCYILRPWAFEIWEQIQQFFDGEIKELGVRNAYFPLFVSKGALEAEKDHVEGFAPEVAWVTKSGSSDLAEPIAIRPTSETIMYPAFSKWITSHRDLPVRLNQWTNVVRWEFKMPTPFLRTREFLWQEGHSAFATREEADEEVLQILDRYARVYEELLAVPVIKGRKSEKEKFAGGLYTTTVEAFIPTNGRAIQGATSHCLGQKFAEMFKIKYRGGEDGGDGKEEHLVWQNSWGLTTRTIGVMIMVHGDDNGLVLPPRVAPIQVVVIAISSVSDDKETTERVDVAARKLTDHLKAAGIRAHYDDRLHQTSGWKYAHWEQKGVPLRLEVGPRDVAKGCASSVRRDNRKRADISIASILAEEAPEAPVQPRGSSIIASPPPVRPTSATSTAVVGLLESIQHDMLERARAERDSRIAMVTEWKDFVPALDRGMMVLTPWCQDGDSEEWVKEATKGTGAGEESAEGEGEEEGGGAATKLSGSAKTLCIPFEQPPMPEGQKCFTGNGKLATAWTLWGRSY